MLAAVLIFAATYLVLAVGRIPFLRVDRTGAAIVGASLMLAPHPVAEMAEEHRRWGLDFGAMTDHNLVNPELALGAHPDFLWLPGEEVKGVYAAKDFVYSYNLLPPFTSRDFSTGKRVAIVGMGNVMVDIARWLLIDAPQNPRRVTVGFSRRLR